MQDFKNDITLILSKERLAAYDSLEQYKENKTHCFYHA